MTFFHPILGLVGHQNSHLRDAELVGDHPQRPLGRLVPRPSVLSLRDRVRQVHRFKRQTQRNGSLQSHLSKNDKVHSGNVSSIMT